MFWRVIRWALGGRMLALCLVGVLLAMRVADPIPVQQLRFAAFDLFQQIQPREFASAPVTILDIDDPSLEAYGQWPWPRSRVADLVIKSFEAGAVAMAFDIVFAEADRLSPAAIAADNTNLPEDIRAQLAELPDNDARLADAIRQTRVILGQTSVRSAQTGLKREANIRPVPFAILGEDARPFLPRFPDLVQNLPAFEDAAAGRGVFSVRPDTDGIYRRVPIAMLVEEELRLGLAPELLRVATGGNAFALRGNAAGVDGVVLGGKLIRTAADGTVWPYLTPSDPARYVSAGALLSGDVPPGRLAGQLILVGTSAIGLEDFRPTALGISMAGVEIHAQLLENILADSLLIRPNYTLAAELFTLAGLSLLVILLVPIMGARLIILLAVLLISSYVACAFYLFQNQRILLDPTWPALGTLLTLIMMASANYIREERERRQIRGAFGQYVSPDLVEKLQQEPDALTLGGERRDLTLLFSDVRGFTTLAEGFRDDPAGLTTLMNSFLTVLSNAILRQGGTIDKFMGDAVMAFWNAPLDLPDHPKAACRAALAMLSDVADLNRTRAEEAEAEGETSLPINVGIGLNTGSCIVGNMGSDNRFDYTALGDTVNLASRLEGQSKSYGLGIILGNATAEAVRDDFAILELDLLRVKGKLEPERIFALMGDETVKSREDFVALEAANIKMREAYAAQNWDIAGQALEEIEAAAKPIGFDMSGYVDLYRARLADFAENPPGPDWDGVFVATSK
ncbi:MAG: adenylate/guanylate cyclase domain-containing protein [Pseudomonadota bacterium]